LCQNRKGTARSEGEQREEAAGAHSWGTSGNLYITDCGFLFPDVILVSYQALETNQKRENREGNKRKKKTAAFLYNNHNPLL
jgi:hypothetical protein